MTKALAWVLSTHPGPSLVVAALTTFFAAMSGAQTGAVVLVAVAMLANQTGIGLGNDWLDATRDKASKRADKPLATGVISIAHARIVSIALAGVALGVSAVLGPVALGLQFLMLASGWWYNLHAKFHWSSPLSYLMGFGLLPAFALSASGTLALPALWIFAVAGLLGVTAHFANALPDLVDDTTHGIRGLPQILGPKRSGVAVLVGAISAAVIIVVFATGTPGPLRFALGLVAIALAVWATVMAFRPTPPRVIFPMVMVVAGLCVLGLGFSL